MIPHHIRLRGFLSYQDEQEISFANASLWMLSGGNGSGKSSVFDAMTYALFGHHRGGGTGAQELINKQSDGTLIEFDFLLDSKLYRIKRTLKRDTKGGARSTQLVLHHDGNGWAAIPGTEKKGEFDAWINRSIGLDYRTFTSSVLLLQGQAEKLLDSSPEGRRSVLAGIIDLGRYEKLYECANEHKLGRDRELKLLRTRLEAMVPIQPMEYQASVSGVEYATERRSAASDEIERLRGVEFLARDWVQLQQQLVDANKLWQSAHDLLAAAAEIEQAVQRQRELRDLLPRLQDLFTQRGTAHQAKVEMERLQAASTKLKDELQGKEQAIRLGEQKLRQLRKEIAGNEERRSALGARLRELTSILEKLTHYDRVVLECKAMQDELAKMPADPRVDLQRAAQRCEALRQAAPLLATLQQFRTRRDELRVTVERESKESAALQQITTRGQQLADGLKKLTEKKAESLKRVEQAVERQSKARTLLNQARASLQEVANLEGATTCHACGQPLTEAHRIDEQQRRKREVNRAETEDKRSNTLLTTARAEDNELGEQLQSTERETSEARAAYRESKAKVSSLTEELTRLRGECNQLLEAMPAAERGRVGVSDKVDLLATEYPAPADLQRLRDSADELPAAQRALQQAEQLRERWQLATARATHAQAERERLERELPKDHPFVRGESADLHAEEATLEQALLAARGKLTDAEREQPRLVEARDKTQKAHNDLEGKVHQQKLTRDHAEATGAQLLKALPENWRAAAEKVGLSQLTTWKDELTQLDQSGTEERGQALAEARVKLDVFQRDREALELRRAEFPPAGQRELAAVQLELAAAKQRDRDCEEALSEAKQRLAQLDEQKRQRTELEATITKLEGDLEIDATLSELLGRGRLQLHLVRQAEKQVVVNANAVLDRLSDGALCLKFVGEADGEGGAGKALDLEAYNRVTGERPINVAFLSGSQRFRVAVSLALGIGQYASRLHRPIDAVIIDEGFGCLDGQGRQVMIRELQSLREQMKFILLVSHQEEFADAFPDGYHFTLERGATRVQRIRR